MQVTVVAGVGLVQLEQRKGVLLLLLLLLRLLLLRLLLLLLLLDRRCHLLHRHAHQQLRRGVLGRAPQPQPLWGIQRLLKKKERVQYKKPERFARDLALLLRRYVFHFHTDFRALLPDALELAGAKAPDEVGQAARGDAVLGRRRAQRLSVEPADHANGKGVALEAGGGWEAPAMEQAYNEVVVWCGDARVAHSLAAFDPGAAQGCRCRQQFETRHDDVLNGFERVALAAAPQTRRRC